MSNSIYKCPVCGQSFYTDNHVRVCPENHSFDVAKEGYINLLLKKASKDPGDSQMAVESRRKFLGSGYYDILSDKLSEKILEYLPKDSTLQVNILDIGCGEGFYLSRLQKLISENIISPKTHLWGLDVSKSAIRLASKSNPLIDFCVGNTNSLPYEDSSVDFALSVFAPLNPEEASRILKENGKLFVVTPGKDHLSGLVKLVYENANPHKEDKDPTKSHPKLKWQETVIVKDVVEISGQENILNLLSMTPYYWSIGKERKENLERLNELETDLDFKILIYSKDSILG